MCSDLVGVKEQEGGAPGLELDQLLLIDAFQPTRRQSQEPTKHGSGTSPTRPPNRTMSSLAKMISRGNRAFHDAISGRDIVRC
jgi:hypothetical protein